ncbi:MAG: DNA-binding protein [Rhodospirillum sp.]|nr:DNA-binding protein [Rhodospirillum sp.]
MFDPWSLSWAPDAPNPSGEAPAPTAPPLTTLPLTVEEAVGWLHRPGARIRRVPVAVIGPKEATDRQREVARDLGRRLGRLNPTVLCGGRGGVMEAVCQGCMEEGGMPIGLLPDGEWETANDYVAIPLATGIGPARNALIARAARVLVAVGGGHGTLTEMAFGVHFNRLVLGLEEAPAVPDALYPATMDAAMGHLCRHLLRLDDQGVS